MREVVQWTGVFWRKKTYDRSTVLAAADAARGRGSIRKAIAGYTKILEQDPADHQVHARVAPLYARTKRWNEARHSFDAAGAGFLKAGFTDKAIAVYALAAQSFPEDVEYWERIANEQVKRGRKADAVKALLDGRRRLRAKRQRPMAIELLRLVLTLDAFHFEATLDLARLLAGDGQRRDAEKLLREMRMWVRGRNVRRLRAAQFRLSPSFATLMDWILGK
jgi:tetratricopeptide (TPR) repeat protein